MSRLRPTVHRPPALEHRNYRLYLVAQAISVVGTWMQNLGQAWLVLTLSADPLILGLVVAAQGVPVAAFGLFGGAVADRIPKRRLIAITQSLMLVLALGLGLLCISGRVEIWHVVAFAFAIGSVFSVDFPARQAFVVELVGQDGVASAVALNSTVYSAGRLVGPAIAGFVIAAATAVSGSAMLGTGIAFVVNAMSFAALLLALALMRDTELVHPPRTRAPRTIAGIVHEIGEGLRFVRGAPVVATVLLVPGLIATIAVNFNVLVPVLATENGLDAGGLGVLLAAAGLGSLLSALRIGMGGPAGPRAVVAGAVLLGIAEIATGAVPLPAALLVLLFLAGSGASTMRTAANTTVQLGTPQQLRGRVMGIFTIVFEGASPIGGLLSGALAGALGARASFVVTGVAAALLAAIAGRLLLARPRPEAAAAASHGE